LVHICRRPPQLFYMYAGSMTDGWYFKSDEDIDSMSLLVNVSHFVDDQRSVFKDQEQIVQNISRKSLGEKIRKEIHGRINQRAGILYDAEKSMKFFAFCFTYRYFSMLFRQKATNINRVRGKGFVPDRNKMVRTMTQQQELLKTAKEFGKKSKKTLVDSCSLITTGGILHRRDRDLLLSKVRT
jgi:hypothetical protein